MKGGFNNPPNARETGGGQIINSGFNEGGVQ